MISTLYLMTPMGEVLVEKQFREKIPRSCLEDFWSHVTADPLNASTVYTQSKFSFIHSTREGVVFVAAVAHEVPPMLILEMLHMVHTTLEAYLKEVNEDSIRENFSLVYQVLEDLLDGGYPLTTELHVMKELVPPPTIEHKVKSLLDSKKASRSLESNMVPWRPQGIKYASNEIFFDVQESLDVLIDAEGGIVQADVRGIVTVNCKLSGMPDVTAHVHNSEMFDDVAFHRCVRHARYDTDRSLSFVPPDGNFTLIEYRCKPFHSLQPPFYVTPQVSFNKEGGRINCMVGLRHGGMHLTDKEKEVHKVAISVPLPRATENVVVGACTQGTYSFDSATSVLTWKIGHIGSTTPSLSAEIVFGSNTSDEILEGTGESVAVEFTIPNVAMSGIKIDTVNVLNESYKPYKGVKYITKSGRFNIRMV